MVNKLLQAWRLYRSAGLRYLIDSTMHYVAMGSAIAPYLRARFPVLHQKLYVKKHLGYWPHIRKPRTFNEHVLHRKVCTTDPRFVRIADKWAVREYVKARVGADILTTVYHVTEDPSTIPFEDLPEEYVLKPTHLSGPVEIVDRDTKIDEARIIATCNEWLSRTHGIDRGEYWYGDILRRIIVEERLHGIESAIPRDYKFFVFHGNVEYIEVDFDRFNDHRRRFYDRNWNPQEFELRYPLGPEAKRPDGFSEMLGIAEKLGSGFEFMRVDLYATDGAGIVFGELTPAPGSGEEPFYPRKYDFELGELW